MVCAFGVRQRWTTTKKRGGNTDSPLWPTRFRRAAFLPPTRQIAFSFPPKKTRIAKWGNFNTNHGWVGPPPRSKIRDAICSPFTPKRSSLRLETRRKARWCTATLRACGCGEIEAGCRSLHSFLVFLGAKIKTWSLLGAFFFLSKKNNHPTPPRAGSTQEPRRHFTTSRTPPLQRQPRATGQCRYPRGEAKTEQHRRRVPHGQQVKKFLLSAVCASKETFPNTAGALLPSL